MQDTRVCSGYIIGRDPERFGGKQEDYKRRADEICRKGVSRIQEAIEKRKDLKQVFFDLLGFFKGERRRIAFDHGLKSEEAMKFGRRRDTEHTHWISFTPLGFESEVYKEYGKKILRLFWENLEGKIPTQKTGVFVPFELSDYSSNEIFEYSSKYGTSLRFEKHQTQEKIFGPFLETLRGEEAVSFNVIWTEIHRILNTPEYENIDTAPFLTEEQKKLLEKMFKTARVIKTKWPEFNEIRITNSTADRIKEKLSLPTEFRPTYLVAIASFQNKGKTWETTRYYIQYDQMLSEMQAVEWPRVMLCHQEQILTQETLEEVATIFEKAIQWTKNEGTKKLTNRVALMRYLFAHAMPFIRGSSAIGEWLERGIYLFHGFNNFKYIPGKMIDLEAFSSPLFSDFMKNYEDMISLGETHSEKDINDS